ncbi:hypothetical protein RC74_18535 [Falsihalocynthiibacter arcticus]|uniref:Uncharacterized protein n=1 Tax=Falsihalocynthiibacter arcticus TaxID=1579316 RepID=A0A126V4T9_9RHOB|nr:hypothetical protein RC74_18535 [Falsihalocynthiibacter arcticus]
MLSTFTLLTLGSTAFRLGLNRGLKTKTDYRISVPQILVGALIVLAGLPDILKPIPYPLPLSLTLGFFLPDLLLRRVTQ